MAHCLQVFFEWPLLLFPCAFHSTACSVTFDGSFHSLLMTHLHFFSWSGQTLALASPTGYGLALCQGTRRSAGYTCWWRFGSSWSCFVWFSMFQSLTLAQILHLRVKWEFCVRWYGRWLPHQAKDGKGLPVFLDPGCNVFICAPVRLILLPR